MTTHERSSGMHQSASHTLTRMADSPKSIKPFALYWATVSPSSPLYVSKTSPILVTSRPTSRWPGVWRKILTALTQWRSVTSRSTERASGLTFSCKPSRIQQNGINSYTMSCMWFHCLRANSSGSSRSETRFGSPQASDGLISLKQIQSPHLPSEFSLFSQSPPTQN